MPPEIHVGAIVGYRGHRAYVRELGPVNVRIEYRAKLRRSRCRACGGSGELHIMKHNDRYTRDCRGCQGKGYLPEGTYPRKRWVERSELTEAPPREKSDPESVALAADLYRKAGAR